MDRRLESRSQLMLLVMSPMQLIFGIFTSLYLYGRKVADEEDNERNSDDDEEDEEYDDEMY